MPRSPGTIGVLDDADGSHIVTIGNRLRHMATDFHPQGLDRVRHGDRLDVPQGPPYIS